MAEEIRPPQEWEPLPAAYLERYFREGSAVSHVRFAAPVQQMIYAGEIEVEFRVKDSRGPDARNQWWWRRKTQQDLF
jgi:hypothetical protein